MARSDFTGAEVPARLRGGLCSACVPVMAAALMGTAGCCGRAGPIVSTRTNHVVILPGIQGAALDLSGLRAFRRQIETENPNASAQIWDWTCIEPQLGTVNRLQDLARNRRRAMALADRITEWRGGHADAKLFIVAHSAGTGIALFACDYLSGDVDVDRVVLISSGVSPTYDLRRALDRVAHGVFNYYSEKDTVVLRDFTTRHGTIDREYGPAAGCVGFHCSDPRLRQLRWTSQMRHLGNHGGHSEGFGKVFASEYLLPLLRPDDDVPEAWRPNDPHALLEELRQERDHSVACHTVVGRF